jgi:hypothetical protein
LQKDAHNALLVKLGFAHRKIDIDEEDTTFKRKQVMSLAQETYLRSCQTGGRSNKENAKPNIVVRRSAKPTRQPIRTASHITEPQVNLTIGPQHSHRVSLVTES